MVAPWLPATGRLVAEDDGNGLVVDALVGQQHGFALGAGCALAAVHEVDGAAVDLLGRTGQHAVGVDLALGLAAAVAQLVVKSRTCSRAPR